MFVFLNSSHEGRGSGGSASTSWPDQMSPAPVFIKFIKGGRDVTTSGHHLFVKLCILNHFVGFSCQVLNKKDLVLVQQCIHFPSPRLSCFVCIESAYLQLLFFTLYYQPSSKKCSSILISLSLPLSFSLPSSSLLA